jgi:predicted ABC-type ATPase
MAKVYIIAGAPGIGKSTSGRYIVPPNIEILNHDNLLLYYKYKETVDYEDLANLKANNFIVEQLKSNNDFGIELNLGFENHYDLLLYIKEKYPHFQIEVILFHTDNVEICIDRVLLRAKAGGHVVNRDIVIKMYENMLPLIQKYAYLIQNIQLVDVDFGSLETVYSNYIPIIPTLEKFPNWVKSLAPETLNLERF